jgi:hypothetical protein
VYTHHIWRPQGGSSHGAGPWATDSQREISVRLKILARLAIILASLAVKFLFARLASLATKFVCETREKPVLLRNFFLRDSQEAILAKKFRSNAFRDSRCKISVCETHEKRVSLLILTRESRENLARILVLNSESRFSREFQKVILVSTQVHNKVRGSLTKSL